MKSPKPLMPVVIAGYENAVNSVVCANSVASIDCPWTPLWLTTGKPKVLVPNGVKSRLSRSQALLTAWLNTVLSALLNIVGNPNDVGANAELAGTARTNNAIRIKR